MADGAVQQAGPATSTGSATPAPAIVGQIQSNLKGPAAVRQFSEKAVAMALQAHGIKPGPNALMELAKADPALAAKIAKIDNDSANAINESWQKSIEHNAREDRKASQRHEAMAHQLSHADRKQMAQLRVLGHRAARAIEHAATPQASAPAVTHPSPPLRNVTRAVQPPGPHLSAARELGVNLQRIGYR